jgi:FMN phosphatase YigB (HAD superfamily)
MTRPYDVLLLDLNGTFMFGHDRLGPDEPFGRTYRDAGGRSLTDDEVVGAVRDLVDAMTEIYGREDRRDSFPSVRETLRDLPSTRALPPAEHDLLERVVAAHEIGRVPDRCAEYIRRLAGAYRLGLISNLWSRPDPWRRELERAGLAGAFEWTIFSSDGRSIKPSPRMFDPVFATWAGPRDRVLMIGDSLPLDVAAAHAVGIRSLWITSDPASAPASPAPDHCAGDLLDTAALLLPNE